MARPLKPFIRGGGYYPSRRWTPLVYPGGYTTANGGGNPEPEAVLKTVTGSLIHITDALALPAEALTVNVEPVQSGSGDPSPENVRPISGFTGLSLYHSGADTSDYTTLSISWQTEAGTVYGGTLDVTTGVLTVDRISETYDGSNDENITYRNIDSGIACFQITPTYAAKDPKSGNVPNIITSIGLKPVSYTWSNLRSNVPAIAVNSSGSFITSTSNSATVEEYRTELNTTPLQVVYELATPQTYQLTPQEVTLLLGENNVWADAGDSTLTYYAEG